MKKAFKNQESDYLTWLLRNPDGFVLNRYSRGNSPNYMVLHRTSCRQINKPGGTAKPGGFTEREYMKVCATERESLESYVRQHGRPDGTFSKECQLCNPSSQRLRNA